MKEKNELVEYLKSDHDYDFSMVEWKDEPPFKDWQKYIKENKKGLSQQSRNWVFTIHQPQLYWQSIDDFRNTLQSIEKLKNTKYLMAFELGETGRTFHLQCYIEFKTPRKKEAIIRIFKNPNIYMESARGNRLSQFNYIGKTENSVYQKLVFTNINMNQMQREDMNISDYVDFIIENNIHLNEQTLDRYCYEFRNNPTTAGYKATKLYYVRKYENKKDYFKIPFVLSGASGSGKSILSNWLIEKAGYKFQYDVFKMEANGDKEEKLWFTSDTPLKTICWFSEINTHFPIKHNLLSLLDGQSRLNIKGKDSIPNAFGIVVLNSTNLTPYYIYNLTQFDKTSYDEISRRLFKGKQYFIIPNPEWTFDEFGNINNLDNIDDIIEKYPPLIFKFIGKEYPEHNLNIRLDRRNHYKNNIFEVREFKNKLYVKEISYYLPANSKQYGTKLNNGEWLTDDDYTVITNYPVIEITPQELLNDFKNSIK